MDNTKCGIAVLNCIYNDTNCKKIVYLVKCLILVDHFLIYAEEMLYSSVYFTRNTRIVYMLFNLCHYIPDELFSCFLAKL